MTRQVRQRLEANKTKIGVLKKITFKYQDAIKTPKPSFGRLTGRANRSDRREHKAFAGTDRIAARQYL